jgi:hypothetical protein
MGNFVSSQRTPPRDYGMIVNLRFSKQGGRATLDSAELKPVWVKFTSKDGSYDITVLPVYALDDPKYDALVSELSQDDIRRIAEVNAEFELIAGAV